MYMKIRLKELCRLKGISQKELASTLGISEMTLSRVTKGNTSLSLLERISKTLDVPFTDLFEKPADVSNTFTCPHCGKRLKLSKEE